jgi:hypothetical protein
MTDLDRIASRLFWWQSPAEALANPIRFLAQVMTYGTVEDLAVVQDHFPADALQNVLANPPAGVFDPRSWNYWHVRFGLPTPALPKREFEPGDDELDHQLENDPRFLRRIEEARQQVREGLGVRLEDIEE